MTALLVLALCAAAPEGPRTFQRTLTATDGATSKLFRFVPAGGGKARTPVLLVPDLSLDRSVYDLRGQGLARALQGRGFDVFVIEPRGHGGAPTPGQSRLTDVATLDVKAALAEISRARGSDGPVDLLVHGYSGALVLGAVPRELEGRVRRVIAVSPAVAPDPPTPAMQLFFDLGANLPALAVSPDGANLFELLFTRNGRFDPGTHRDLLRGVEGRMDSAARAQWRRWLEEGTLRFGDGATLTERLADYALPTLLILAMGDNFVHPDFASPLRDLSPRAKISVRVLSKRELLREDSSHLSVFFGRDADVDVFLPVVRFLEAVDPQRPAPALISGETAP